jgi:hypothetical protein
MSKITFRADEDLVARIEACEGSKSEVMREALRAYLDDPSARNDAETAPAAAGSIDALVERRVDALVEDRVDAVLADRLADEPQQGRQDINVNVSLDPASTTERSTGRSAGETVDDPSTTVEEGDTERKRCSGCGESLDGSPVYCPNCGEKANHRVFCECGDELRSDWAFCPGCGRRTPAADVLERS